MLQRIKQKTDGWEDALREGLFRFRVLLFLLVVSVLAVIARVYFFPFVSGDYTEFLHNWLNEIRELGGLRSLGVQIGNYTAPYHYLLAVFTYIPGLDNLAVIKITSTLGDFAMAAGGFALIRALTKSAWKAAAGYAVLLCLPTVFLNSAAWGQCDAMYTAFVLWALALWFRDKKAISMLLYGLALAVKLQAVFILPAFVIFWLCGRLRLRQLLCVAVGYFVAFLPAIVASGSLACLTEAYRMQTVVHTLAVNIFNGLMLLMQLNQEQVYMLSGGFVVFALLAVGIVAFYCWQKRSRFTRETELTLCLFMLCLVVYLMPGMRERYFYMAECLSVVYAICRPSRFWVPLVLQLGVVPTYLYYLTLYATPPVLGVWLVPVMALPALACFVDLLRGFRAGVPAAAVKEP